MRINTRKEYFEYDALSYSMLKAFDKDPSSVLKENNISGAAIDYGSAVDVLMFDGEEEYHKQFSVISATKPSDTGLKLVDYMLSKDSVTRETAKQGIIDLGLWKNMKIETSVKKYITEEFMTYAGEVYDSEGKTVLDVETNQRVGEAVYHLCNNPYCAPYFINTDEIEVLTQFAWVFEHQGQKFKCMLDALVIDKKEKTITPVDLKTTSGSYSDFKFNALKYRYDLQAQLYSLGVFDFIQKSDAFGSYTLKNFMFVVSAKGAVETPHVYMMDPEMFLTKINQKSSVKYNDLLDIVKKFNEHSSRQDFVNDIEMQKHGYITL
jgi:hypothetical protein